MKESRHRRIAELLRQHHEMTVRDLALELKVSEATVRRDLQELNGAAGFKRMHGGIAYTADEEPPVIARRRDNAAQKQALARRAAAEIPNGSTIFIGSGSTMACLAECLVDHQELSVVTNAHNVAAEFAHASGVDVLMTGGALRKSEMSTIGPIAQETLRSIAIESAYMSVHGVSAQVGLTNSFAPEAETDRVVVEVAPRLVVVAEAHKIGKVAPIPVGGIEAVDLLVTDASEHDGDLGELVALGLQLATVASAPAGVLTHDA